ncbi:hypothetical protein BHE74_00017244 [Ensete ventricosum]|uniref:Uncharacterized protein n=1 Tax=Ensete ventricosum TaxID=4639 RepID=A0A444GI89_ENSVE|nr:hypothetical protein GW17_00000609 [Ensete ventricosum]RWW74799.1 hypothetical protein BHE74_00017244 [Ensete ventricosum]RZR71407.1 hypothetical protein BHM03_00004962 [Ensete ventricosum]
MKGHGDRERESDGRPYSLTLSPRGSLRSTYPRTRRSLTAPSYPASPFLPDSAVRSRSGGPHGNGALSGDQFAQRGPSSARRSSSRDPRLLPRGPCRDLPQDKRDRWSDLKCGGGTDLAAVQSPSDGRRMFQAGILDF